MKVRTLLTISALAITTLVSAARKGDGIITIKTNKASRELVYQWINAYKEVHPEISISIVKGNDQADLTLVNNHKTSDVTYVGRFALLPVTSTHNPLINEVEKKQWNDKELRKLFFQTEDDLIEEASKRKRNTLADRLTVFSGNNETSAAEAFALHYGLSRNDIRGKRIAGDDLYLLNAIEKETQSVTFNNLAYIFDTTTRTLKPNLVLLPLSLKREQQDAILSGNLDNALNILEEQSIDIIPVENFGFAYSSIDSDIEGFLSWVINEGQQYNHKAGFLRLNTHDAKQQLNLLAQNR